MSLTRLVRQEMQKPTVPGSGVTKGQVVAEKIVNLAQAGDKVLIPVVWRYMDGDPKAAADLTLRELVEQLADRMGLDARTLLADVEREIKNAGAA